MSGISLGIERMSESCTQRILALLLHGVGQIVRDRIESIRQATLHIPKRPFQGLGIKEGRILFFDGRLEDERC